MHTDLMRIACALIAGILLPGCASTTMIHSSPEGAKLYVDGEMRGNTPFAYSDQKIVGSSTHLRLVKDGYQEANVLLQRNEEFSVGACIGGVLVLFPFLWIMSYKADHTYELTPLQPRAAIELPPIPFRLLESAD